MKKQKDLHIPADHPAFPGHFPGMPIVPGVVLLDEALHAMEDALAHVSSWKISSVKFLSPLGPDSHVVIEYEQQAQGSFHFDIREGERLIATGIVSPGEGA